MARIRVVNFLEIFDSADADRQNSVAPHRQLFAGQSNDTSRRRRPGLTRRRFAFFVFHWQKSPALFRRLVVSVSKKKKSSKTKEKICRFTNVRFFGATFYSVVAGRPGIVLWLLSAFVEKRLLLGVPFGSSDSHSRF